MFRSVCRAERPEEPTRSGGRPIRNVTPTRLWIACLERARTALSSDQKVLVPAYLPHPAAVGFRPLDFADANVPERDWIAPQPDGSRLHAHESADGTLILHRDQYDPGAGALDALAQLATETRLGRAAVLVGGIWLGAKLLSVAGA